MMRVAAVIFFASVLLLVTANAHGHEWPLSSDPNVDIWKWDELSLASIKWIRKHHVKTICRLSFWEGANPDTCIWRFSYAHDTLLASLYSYGPFSKTNKYDLQDSLIEVATPTSVVKYRDSGTSRIEERFSNGAKVRNVKYYNGLHRIDSEIYGAPTAIDNTLRVIFHYDAQNRCTSVVSVSPDETYVDSLIYTDTPQPHREYTYRLSKSCDPICACADRTFDLHHNVIRELRNVNYRHGCGGLVDTEIFTYEYDIRDRPVRKTYQGPFTHFTMNYVWNSDDSPSSVTTIRADGSSFKEEEYIYEF